MYKEPLTLSLRWSLSHRNQSIDLLCKSMDWFLNDRDLRHERVNNKTRIIAHASLAQHILYN